MIDGRFQRVSPTPSARPAASSSSCTILRVLLLRICDMVMLALYKDYTHGLFELGCWIWTCTLDGLIVHRLYPLHKNLYNGTNIEVEDESQLANEKLDVNVSYM